MYVDLQDPLQPVSTIDTRVDQRRYREQLDGNLLYSIDEASLEEETEFQMSRVKSAKAFETIEKVNEPGS